MPEGIGYDSVFRVIIMQFIDAAIFDVRLKLYANARHETLNETNRQEVIDDFITWCDEVVAARA